MLIRSEFDIQFSLPCETPFVALLDLHPSVDERVRERLPLQVEGVAEGGVVMPLETKSYLDGFGNRCERFLAPAGELRLRGTSTLEAEDAAPVEPVEAQQWPVQDLPDEVLQFLLSSRYCEVDRFNGIAMDLFGWTELGWQRAAAIRDWVHHKVAFNYMKARSTKTAMDVFTEREGVCRDYQHLAVTLSRALNIPARYVTGYLGDIRIPVGGPGDFSAWYQVYLDGRWWNMDARHNGPRLGRVLMATGRDAADVAITTSFGQADLKHFFVESYEVDAVGVRVVPQWFA